MNAARSKPIAGPAGPSLTITRVFDAPRDLVFKAWTDPEALKKWSCPKGFRIEFGESTPSPGGTWRCGMRAPDGRLHVAVGTYREILKPQRLVITHAWEDDNGRPGHQSLVTITLTEQAGKTTMIFTQSGFKSEESRDGHRGGWTQAFDNLADHLQNKLG